MQQLRAVQDAHHETRPDLPSFSCAQQSSRQGGTWVRATGELDLASAPQLAQALHQARTRSLLTVLDLRRLHFIDLHGLRVILTASHDAERLDRRLVIVPGPPHIEQIFDLTGTTDLVQRIRFC